jgi:hypothetical protein
MQGAGKDIERGGEKVSDAARKVRNDWREAWRHDEADYDAARTRCGGLSEPARDECRERERATYRQRMANTQSTYHRSDMRSETDEDRREDAYLVARDRCWNMRNQDEDRCITDARTQYRYTR